MALGYRVAERVARLGGLVDLEASQAKLLDLICSGPMITRPELASTDVLSVSKEWRKTLKVNKGLFDGAETESE